MFAIIKTGGKQIKVSQGDEIFVEKLEGEDNDQVLFSEVLMIDDKIGTPLLQDACVVGKIIKQGKQKKIVVFKYKPKKNYRRKYGHRQPYTKILIEQISLSKIKLTKPKIEPSLKDQTTVATKPEAIVEAKPTSVESIPVVEKQTEDAKKEANKPTTVKKTTTTASKAPTMTKTATKPAVKSVSSKPTASKTTADKAKTDEKAKANKPNSAK